MPAPRPVTLADGRTCRSVADAAKVLGVATKTVFAWLREGRPLAPRVNISELARGIGLHPSSLAYRLRQGMTLDIALSTPRMRGPRSLHAMRYAECAAILDRWLAGRS